ncbi:SIMPL domain-containing protein [Otariodibacter sp.]|uniref:SIMPL domain-containing protein n=1 Tax=Otariodibacter sp. TaxID=3030919 RepID=UPI002606CA22|nr:SIMPL domain-containing protein [Otariodibacter sp.]
MKLHQYLSILPLALTMMDVSAEVTQPVNQVIDKQGSIFHFSTKVTRTVEKDLMRAQIYSRQSGKSLLDIKKKVSVNLNKVLESIKQYSSINVSTTGISNRVDYDDKGKAKGWVAEGQIVLQSKDFEIMAKVLETLGNDVAIDYVNFSISPEKRASLEDEMTVEIINQFKHKAEVIQQSLQAKNYVLSEITLNTPNSGGQYQRSMPVMYATKSLSAMEDDSLPLEAGTGELSATASGKIIFNQE